MKERKIVEKPASNNYKTPWRRFQNDHSEPGGADSGLWEMGKICVSGTIYKRSVRVIAYFTKY
jgi:hypothetical protein